MNALPFNRQDVADALVAYASLHHESDLYTRLLRGNFDRTRDLAFNASLIFDRTVWETLDYLDPSTREHYFALVSKLDGKQTADELRESYDRIQRANGVTIHVENSDDDPYQVNFHVSDDIADAWADAHGSLCGGTWECPDGDTSFVYDIGYWYPGLWEELEKDGYDLDFSSWSDPDENDQRIAKHADGCEQCQHDFREAERHLEMSKERV